jgi:hypothetical protein
VAPAFVSPSQFNYLKWFPNGNGAAEYLATEGALSVQPQIIGWRDDSRLLRRMDRARDAPVVRASAERDYRGHFRNYILDALGDVTLENLSLAHLEDLRVTLRKRGLSEKTIRNGIDGSFRALVCDAMRDDIAAAFPFAKVRWPEKIVPGPSPFTEEERRSKPPTFTTCRNAQRALSISPLRDLYSAKDTYMSVALTNSVGLTWLSEQTEVAVTTILKRYDRFIHSSQSG